MLADLSGFLARWIPAFLASNRSYLTIAIGCTAMQGYLFARPMAATALREWLEHRHVRG